MAAKLLYPSAQGRRQATGFLSEAGVLLGRSRDSVVPTADPSVTERHCQIIFDQGQWLLIDLGTESGTLVNDKRVTRHTLKHHDVIRCGNLAVQFAEDPPPAPPAPSATELQWELGQARDALTRVSAERDAALAEQGRLSKEIDRLDRVRTSTEEENRRFRERLEQRTRELSDQQRLVTLREGELRDQAQRQAELRAALELRERELEQVRAALAAAQRERDAARRDQQTAETAALESRSKGEGSAVTLLEKEGQLQQLFQENSRLAQQLEDLQQLLKSKDEYIAERAAASIRLEVQLRNQRQLGEQMERLRKEALLEKESALSQMEPLRKEIEALRQQGRRPAAADRTPVVEPPALARLREQVQRAGEAIKDALLDLRVGLLDAREGLDAQQPSMARVLGALLEHAERARDGLERLFDRISQVNPPD